MSRRITWRLRLSLFGILGGLLLGLGLLVTLQQSAIAYPTATLTVAMLLGGLVFGVVLPSLGTLVSVSRTNKSA